MAVALPGPLATQLRGSVGQTTFRVVNGRQVVQAKGGGGARVFPDAAWQRDFFAVWPEIWAEVKAQGGEAAIAAAYRGRGSFWNSLVGGLLLAPFFATSPEFPVQVSGSVPGPAWAPHPDGFAISGTGNEGFGQFTLTMARFLGTGSFDGRLYYGAIDEDDEPYGTSAVVGGTSAEIEVAEFFRHGWVLFAGTTRATFDGEDRPVVFVMAAPARPSRFS